MTEAERRRCEQIMEIQEMLAKGYARVQIRGMLHVTYATIRRYAQGDPYKLCRFSSKPPEAEQYRDEIIELLQKNTSYKQIQAVLSKLGYQGKRTALLAYCRKLIAELGIPYRARRAYVSGADSPPAIPRYHYITRAELFKHIWSGMALADGDLEFIMKKYLFVPKVLKCVSAFRAIYNSKKTALLHQYIEEYSSCSLEPIRAFASGLQKDIVAVENSVTLELSNGFVEGTNNKIKAIKRTMYGRAKIDLLRVKVLYSR